MKSKFERIHDYTDEYLESILLKRNGYEEAVVFAVIEEAITRGMIASAEDVNSKYPLIPGGDDFGENLLVQVHQNCH